MNLSVSEEHAGKSARCPGCGSRVTVPSADKASASAGDSSKSSNGAGDRPADQQREIKHRTGWQESDPANPNLLLSFGVGISINVYILLLGLALRKTYVYTILFDRGWVNFAETFVFSWGMAIIILKYKKLVHQRNALLLDVLPQSLGREINSDNVSKFVDHVYGPGFQSTPVSGSHSYRPKCVSSVSLLSTFSDTAPGRPSRLNGSP